MHDYYLSLTKNHPDKWNFLPDNFFCFCFIQINFYTLIETHFVEYNRVSFEILQKTWKSWIIFWILSKISFFQKKQSVRKLKLSIKTFFDVKKKQVFWIKRHFKEFVLVTILATIVFLNRILSITLGGFLIFFFLVAFWWKNSFKEFQFLAQQALNVLLSNEI